MNIDLDNWEAGYAHGQQGGPPRCAIDLDQVQSALIGYDDKREAKTGVSIILSPCCC